MEDNLPTIEEYHLTLSRNVILSLIILVMNATSPPGVHISPGDPVHDFDRQLLSRKTSLLASEERGIVRRKLRLIFRGRVGTVRRRRHKRGDYTYKNPIYVC
jgi:hypothetical protein